MAGGGGVGGVQREAFLAVVAGEGSEPRLEQDTRVGSCSALGLLAKGRGGGARGRLGVRFCSLG